MKAYTVNNHLVGVGNDQILGTDQGGGGGVEYEAGQYISIDENNVISVTGVAPATALPTTEFGKFIIQNNVSGGPIEVLVPTDQGHAVYTVLMDSNSVSGTYEVTGGYKGVLFKSPGYDNDYWNYTAGTVTMHVPEAVTGVANIYACYASNSTPTGSYQTGPSFFSYNPWSIPDQSTYILQPGNYEISVAANQVPEYAGGYGKYISIVANGPGPDINALSKISFAGMERHPELGYDVNLNRYELGNTSTTTSPYGFTEAVIYTDPNTKKQTVLMPSSAPSSWNLKTAVLFQYGSSSFGYSNADTSHDYIAYKYDSTTRNYEFAELVHTDYNAKKFTFARTYNGTIEYWIADCTNGYYSATWSTEIPKFEVDTNGQAYKLVSNNIDVINNTNWASWFSCMQSNNSTNWPKGKYEINIDSNISFVDAGNNPTTANKLRIGWHNGSAFTDYVTVDISNNKAIWNNPSDFTYTNSADGYFLFMFYNGNTRVYGGTSSNYPFTSILYESTGKEEYLTDGDLELNGDNQVTAIDGYALAGGGATYSAGQNISIDNQNVISVTGLAQADWDSSSGPSEILNKPEEIGLYAGQGITVEVTGASAIISAQSGGGGHEYTAGPGIEINNYEISTTELASGLQLVAGDNVTMTVSGNNLVFSAAKGVTKTLLYTGSSSDSRKGSFTLSQSGYNFDRLEMTLIDVNDFVIKQICEMPADNLVNSNGTRGSSFNSITSGTNTWFKAMNWQLNAAGTTLTYWVDEISTSGNSVTAINRDQTGNRPIMLRIYGVKD